MARIIMGEYEKNCPLCKTRMAFVIDDLIATCSDQGDYTSPCLQCKGYIYFKFSELPAAWQTRLAREEGGHG
jgi:hypothetical protein